MLQNVIVFLFLYWGPVLSKNAADSSTLTGSWKVSTYRKENADFFTSMGPHETPLLLCDKGFDGKYYSKPIIPDCSVRLRYASSPKTVHMTFWVLDMNSDNIKGFHCFAIRRTRMKAYDGLYRVARNSDQKQILTVSQCKDMSRSFKTPEGHKMHLESDGYFTYLETHHVDFSWLRNNTVSWVDYHLQQYGIGIDPNDLHITSMAGLTKECYSDAGDCPTFRGMLVWNPEEQTKCPVIDGHSTTCFLSGEALTCPMEQMVLTGLSSKVICNMTFGSSDQQVLFTPDSESWNSMTLTDEIKKIQRRRIKRSTFSTQAKMNAQFQFLQEMTNENLYMLQDRICQLSKGQVRQGLRTAESGNPDSLVEAMLGPRLRSTTSGDVIHVWKCKEVYEYLFLPEPEVSCSTEWPVKYRFGGVTRKGYMSGSHEIHRDFTPKSCPQPEFFFTSNNTAYLLNARTRFSKFPSLPTPGDSDMANAFVEATFTGGGEYGITDIRGGTTWHEFLQDVQKSVRVTKLLEDEDLLDGTNETLNVWQKIKNFIGDKLSDFTLNWITPVLVIASGIVAVWCCCSHRIRLTKCCCKCIKSKSRFGKKTKPKKRAQILRKSKKTEPTAQIGQENSRIPISVQYVDPKSTQTVTYPDLSYECEQLNFMR